MVACDQYTQSENKRIRFSGTEFGKRKRKDIRKNSTKITLAPSLRIEKKAFMSILIYTNGDKFKSISFEIELVTVSGAFLHRGRVL